MPHLELLLAVPVAWGGRICWAGLTLCPGDYLCDFLLGPCCAVTLLMTPGSFLQFLGLFWLLEEAALLGDLAKGFCPSDVLSRTLRFDFWQRGMHRVQGDSIFRPERGVCILEFNSYGDRCLP